MIKTTVSINRITSFLNVRRLLNTSNITSVWSTNNVVKSQYKNITVPEETAYDYTFKNLVRWPTKTAVVCGLTNRSYTFEQLYKKTRILGASLRKKFGIVDGDVVSIMMANEPEYAILVNGILAAGATVTTLNPVYTATEIKRQVQLSNTKLLFVHPSLFQIVTEAVQLCQKKIPIIAMDIVNEIPQGAVSYKQLMDDRNIDLTILKEVKRKPDDVAFLPYSSGTTGLPKGVESTNRSVIANFEQRNTECRQHRDTTDTNQDTALVILPMFHAYGLILIMQYKLSLGIKCITLPKFSPDTFLMAMKEYKVTNLYLAPPLVLFLATHPQATRSHLETVNSTISGAAPLPAADIHKYLEKLQRDTHFGQGYGLTESTLATISPMGYKNYNSVGFALPNTELRVVDSERRNLGPNEVGELLIKSPGLMKGYRNNPVANAEVFHEEWFSSGDLALIDETGAVYIVDRLKELIKVNAYQVPPAELEAVIKEHPGVLDAAVVGIPDPICGERPRGFVVLKNDSEITEEEIMDFVSEKVAPYKKLKEVLFLDSIPKNPSGKILRRILREKYC